MKLMIFSDVHGNLPAFEVALKHAGAVDGYICLGDTVDYGPWSNECVDLVLSLPNIIYLEGNHEQDFLKGSHTGDNLVANTFFDFCRPRFDRMHSISSLKETYELNNIFFRHTILNKYIYPDSILELDNNYVIGHSHHQFKLENNGYFLYNSGSIGQNRQYINVINYMVYDTVKNSFNLQSITYDVNVVIQKMRDEKYPKLCIDYYENKERLTG